MYWFIVVGNRQLSAPALPHPLDEFLGLGQLLFYYTSNKTHFTGYTGEGESYAGYDFVQHKASVVALSAVRHCVLSWAIMQPRKEGTRMMGMRVFGASRFLWQLRSIPLCLLYSRLPNSCEQKDKKRDFRLPARSTFDLTRNYVAYSVNSLPTFRDNHQFHLQG